MTNQSHSEDTFPIPGDGGGASSVPKQSIPQHQKSPQDTTQAKEYTQEQFDLATAQEQHGIKRQYKQSQRRTMRLVAPAPKKRLRKIPYSEMGSRSRVRDISYRVFIAGVDVTEMLAETGVDSIIISGRDGANSASFGLSNVLNRLTITRDNVFGQWKSSEGIKKQIFLKKMTRNKDFLQLMAKRSVTWENKTEDDKLKSILAGTPLGGAVLKKAGKTVTDEEKEATKKALTDPKLPKGPIGKFVYNKAKDIVLKYLKVPAKVVTENEDIEVISVEEEYELQKEQNILTQMKDALETQFTANNASSFLYELSPGRCIIDRYDTIRIFRRDPIIGGDHWMPAFTGFITTRPKSTSYAENPQSNYAIACGDIRELMRQMRVQQNPQSLMTTNTGVAGAAGGKTVIEPLLYSGYFRDLIDMRDGLFSQVLANTSFTQAMMWLTLGIPAERMEDKAVAASIEQIDKELPRCQKKLEKKLAKLQTLLRSVASTIPELKFNQDAGTLGLFGPLWNTMEEIWVTYGNKPHSNKGQPSLMKDIANLWGDVKTLDTTVKGLQSLRQQTVAKVFRGPIMGIGNLTLGFTPVYPQGKPQKLLEEWHHRMLFGDLLPDPKEGQQKYGIMSGDYGYLTAAEMYFIGLNSDGGEMYSPWEASVHFLLPSGANEVAHNFIQYNQINDEQERREWETRLDMIDDLTERVDYQWYVNPAGDIVFEFPFYDFYPEDFGPSHPVKITSNVTNSYNKKDPLPMCFRVLDTPTNTDSSDEESEPTTMVHVVGGYAWLDAAPDLPSAQMPQAWAWCPAMLARYGPNTKPISLPWLAEGKEEILRNWALIYFQKMLMSVSTVSATHDNRPYLLPNRPYHIVPEGKMGLILSVNYGLSPPPSSPNTSVNLGFIRTQAPDGSWRLITGSPHMPMSYKTLFSQAEFNYASNASEVDFGECTKLTDPEKMTACIKLKLKDIADNPAKYIEYNPEHPARAWATVDEDAWVEKYSYQTPAKAEQIRKSIQAIKAVCDTMGLPHYYMFAIAGAETGGQLDPKTINKTPTGNMGAVGFGQFTTIAIDDLNNRLKEKGAAAKYGLPPEFEGYHVTKQALITPDSNGMISINGEDFPIETAQAYLMGVLYRVNEKVVQNYKYKTEEGKGGNPWAGSNGKPSPEMVLLSYGRGPGCFKAASNAALQELKNKGLEALKGADKLLNLLCPPESMTITAHLETLGNAMTPSFINSIPTAYAIKVFANSEMLKNAPEAPKILSAISKSEGGLMKGAYDALSTKEKKEFRALFVLGQMGIVFNLSKWAQQTVAWNAVADRDDLFEQPPTFFSPTAYAIRWVNDVRSNKWEGLPKSLWKFTPFEVKAPGFLEVVHPGPRFSSKSYSTRGQCQQLLAEEIAGGGSNLPDYKKLKDLTRDYVSNKKQLSGGECGEHTGLGHEQDWLDNILPKFQTASTRNLKGVETMVILAGGQPLTGVNGYDNPEVIW